MALAHGQLSLSESILVQVKAAPLPQAPNDSDLEVSDEDIDFVDEYSQRLGFLTSLNREQIDRYTILPAQALLTH